MQEIKKKKNVSHTKLTHQCTSLVNFLKIFFGKVKNNYNITTVAFAIEFLFTIYT
jgi:hypothetical protein